MKNAEISQYLKQLSSIQLINITLAYMHKYTEITEDDKERKNFFTL